VATKANRKARSPLKSPPHKFVESDYYGSPVYCTVETWDNHILSRPVGIAHAELTGREEDVKRAIRNPERISRSTAQGQKNNAFAFEADTVFDTVRVLVAYNNPAKFQTGTTKGYVITSYVVDARYRSQVSVPIYDKGTTQVKP
jgi:hypothetical protein